MQFLVNNGEGTVRGPRLLDCPRVLAANFSWVLDPWYFVKLY